MKNSTYIHNSTFITVHLFEHQWIDHKTNYATHATIWVSQKGSVVSLYIYICMYHYVYPQGWQEKYMQDDGCVPNVYKIKLFDWLAEG